jgi:hypothetical protein
MMVVNDSVGMGWWCVGLLMGGRRGESVSQ